MYQEGRVVCVRLYVMDLVVACVEEETMFTCMRRAFLTHGQSVFCSKYVVLLFE
jgi:hypothetical protein